MNLNHVRSAYTIIIFFFRSLRPSCHRNNPLLFFSILCSFFLSMSPYSPPLTFRKFFLPLYSQRSLGLLKDLLLHGFSWRTLCIIESCFLHTCSVHSNLLRLISFTINWSNINLGQFFVAPFSPSLKILIIHMSYILCCILLSKTCNLSSSVLRNVQHCEPNMAISRMIIKYY